jgi:predicted Zn-dependent protease
LPGARPALLPPPAPPPLEVSGDLESSTHPALALADLGRTDEALSMLDREIARTGQSAASLGLRGRILLATGSSDRGLEDLRAALYLSSSDALLRFHYAHGLAASKRGRAARSQLIEVLRSIENAAEDTPLADGETTVGSLRRAASELLRRVE